jgi:hypothetical protein
MRRLNIYNKFFIAFCIAMILFIIWKVPHEKEDNNTQNVAANQAEFHQGD